MKKPAKNHNDYTYWLLQTLNGKFYPKSSIKLHEFYYLKQIDKILNCSHNDYIFLQINPKNHLNILL